MQRLLIPKPTPATDRTEWRRLAREPAERNEMRARNSRG
jgi:hypothetical protein